MLVIERRMRTLESKQLDEQRLFRYWAFAFCVIEIMATHLMAIQYSLSDSS